MSETSRLLGLFLHPENTFRDINRNARWWAPFLLLVIANFAVTFTIDRTIGFSALAEQAIRENPQAAERMEGMSPEQRANRLAVSAKLVKYLAFATPVTFLLVVFVVAAVLMGTFNFGLARELRFSPTVAVVMYSMLPGIIYSLLTILVLSLNGHAGDINVQNMVATNPAFFFDPDSMPRSLYALLRVLDIFYIWPLVLMGIGLSASGGGKRSTSLAVVFSWWLLLVIGMVGLRALNS